MCNFRSPELRDAATREPDADVLDAARRDYEEKVGWIRRWGRHLAAVGGFPRRPAANGEAGQPREQRAST
jgi:hypothetical protein